MRKIISTVLISILILSAAALTACGGGSEDYSDSKYIGTWKAAAINVGDESGDVEGEYILTIKEDGTGTLSGEGEDSNFTWKPIDGGFKTKGDVNATFKEDGDKLKAGILAAELVFERE